MDARLRREISFVPRYALVGAGTFAIDVAVFATLLHLFGKQHVGFISLAAGTAGYAFNYLGHRHFTFRNVQKGKKRIEIPLHAGMKFGNQGLRAVLMHLLVARMGMDVWLVYLNVGALISCSNFLLSRWIFLRESPVDLVRTAREFVKLGFRAMCATLHDTLRTEIASIVLFFRTRSGK